MITIIDYGMGNIRSILNMFKRVGYNDIFISSDIKTISKSDKLILPGVGAFDEGISNLNKLNLIDVIKHCSVNKKIPLLGICLGMQLLTKGSDEGNLPGLGLFDAYSKKFN